MNPPGYYPFSDISASPSPSTSIRSRQSVFGKIASMNRPLSKIVADNVLRLMNDSTELSRQVQLAKKAKLSQSSINRLVAGETDCLLITALQVAKSFGVSIYELIEEPKAHQAAELKYDRDRYSRLSESEKASIGAFIEFVMDNHDRGIHDTAVTKLNLHKSIIPAPAEKAARQSAIDTNLSNNALNNKNDEHHTRTRPRRTKRER